MSSISSGRMNTAPYSDAAPGGPGGRDRGAPMSMQEYKENSNRIAHNIQRAIRQLKELQDFFDSATTQTEISQAMPRFRDLEDLIKSIQGDLKELHVIKPPPSLEARAKMDRARLNDNFVEFINAFQQFQKTNAARVKAMNERERNRVKRDQQNQLISLGPGGDGGDPSQPSAPEPVDPLRAQQLQQQVEQDQAALQLIQERDAAMRELEEGVLAVNDIFKDVAQLIHDQGDVIDSIEANVDVSEVRVQQANTNLHAAQNYQKKAQRKKMMIVAILAAIILALVIIIYFMFN